MTSETQRLKFHRQRGNFAPPFLKLPSPRLNTEDTMLRAGIVFFVLGLVAILLGANGIGGLSMDIGRSLLFVFLILAVISFISSLVVGKKVVK